MPSTRTAPVHEDPGLQPERTDLAWGRTTLSMVVAAAIFLRWMPRHGVFVGTLVAVAVVTAFVTNLTRKRRFHRAIKGINMEIMPPDIASTATLAGSVVLLAALGIYVVLIFPLDR